MPGLCLATRCRVDYNRTWMRTISRRTIQAAFLSLLIAVSFFTTGGWFCADGRACMPAWSPTCCCGDSHGAAVKHAACDTPGDHTCLSEPGCGCYRDPGFPPALRPAGRLTLTAPAILPGPTIPFLVPVSQRVSHRPPAPPISPPRFLISPRDTRAPPAA